MHVQKDCPAEYGPHKTIYNRFARWSERGIWQNIFAAVEACSDTPVQVALESSHVKIHRCASGGKGGQAQAIGSAKGGRNSKIHAVLDDFPRPLVLVLTSGNTADCMTAETCVSLIPGASRLLADKSYDTDAFRAFLKANNVGRSFPANPSEQAHSP